jgi:tetratricopeptide (TPR) repeat protein
MATAPQATADILPEDTGVAYVWQLLKLQRPDQALELAERLLALDPQALEPQLARAEALRLLDRLPEALAEARAIIAQAPYLPQGFLVVAQVLGQQGVLLEAEQAIAEALRLAPLEATYYGFLAQLQYVGARPAEVRYTASTGLSLDPTDTQCLLWRALAHEQLHCPEAADADFQSLFALAPTNRVAHTHRGRMLLWRCDAAAAATHLATALALAPTQSAQLVPLLRRAQREQYWPGWLQRAVGQVRQVRGLGLATRAQGLVATVVLPWYRLRSWWLTRHDPLFQHQLPAQPHPLRWYIPAYLLAICIFGYACLLLKIPVQLAIIPSFLLLRKVIFKPKPH